MNNIDSLCINNIRTVCLEMIDEAKSGHPGMALDACPTLHTLFTKVLKISSENPNWISRDRFVLSSGHASSLYYTLLHLLNYNVSKEDLIKFRQLNSITAGHPERGVCDGVDASTGPLGQGVAYGVGFAICEAHLNDEFGDQVNHHTYVLCGDGDLQEGISKEAFALAGVLNLNKLIVLYDSNDIQLNGKVNVCMNENMEKEMQAFNWNYIKVKDGNDCDKILKAILKAKKSDKPSLIEIKNVIGFGTKNQGTNKVHGAPIPHDETVEIRNSFGGNKFDIRQEVYDYYKQVSDINKEKYHEWLNKPHDEVERYLSSDIKIDLSNLVKFKNDKDGNLASRKIGSYALKEIGKQDLKLMGGGADIASSTYQILDSELFAKDRRNGKNIEFGVREQVMGAVANAISLYGMRGFATTFFSFVDYMKESVRLAGLSKLPTLFIYSHDSLAVGEDGPTHQPIEQITMVRSIPNVNVYRPCDANETICVYQNAYNHLNNPSVIVLSRQTMDVVTEEIADLQAKVDKGAYIISKESNKLDGIIIATGSEVKLAIEVKRTLAEEGIDVRVVSMPSIEVFEEQSQEYKNEILPASCTKRLALEMSDAVHFYKYVGLNGKVIGINEFGKSGKANDVMNYFGFNVENIKNKYKEL